MTHLEFALEEYGKDYVANHPYEFANAREQSVVTLISWLHDALANEEGPAMIHSLRDQIFEKIAREAQPELVDHIKLLVKDIPVWFE